MRKMILALVILLLPTWAMADICLEIVPYGGKQFIAVSECASVVTPKLVWPTDHERGVNPTEGFKEVIKGGIRDWSTGLMWTKKDGTFLTRDKAITYCSELNYASYWNWRLPTKDELFTIKDPVDLLNVNKRRNYWSSSTSGSGDNNIAVKITSGKIVLYKDSVKLSVKCVR